jgi:hypothetical protein
MAGSGSGRAFSGLMAGIAKKIHAPSPSSNF